MTATMIPQPSAEAKAWFATLASLAKPAGGKLVLASFGEDPESGAEIQERIAHIDVADPDAPSCMLETAAAWSAEPGRNVYLGAFTVDSDLPSHKKGGEKDVRAVLAIVADFDALTDGERAGAYLDRLPLPPSMVLETSSGSFQSFYFLSEPASVGEAKPIATALAALTGCDSCAKDVSHVWRVPGLPNRPIRKKIAKGRSPEPFTIRMVKTGRKPELVSLDALRQAIEAAAPVAPAASPATAAPQETTPAPRSVWRPIPDKLLFKLWHAPADGEDKSEAAYACIKAHAEHGHSADEIVVAFAAHPESAAALHYSSPEQLAADVARISGKPSSAPKWVEDMNARYSVVNDGGQVVVFRPVQDAALRRDRYERISFEDLKKLHMHETIEVGTDKNGRPIYQDIGTAWLKHARRKQFAGGVTFEPSGAPVPADTLNLWRGFAYRPAQGDWSLMRSHIRDVLCCGNEDYFAYFMGWCARAIQRPAEPGEVAIVLRGGRGAGKGIFAHWYGRVFGQHYVPITHARHLVGNFNAHLRDGVVAFADEAFYAGDRQHESVLKALVTEPYLQIEAKYQNAVMVRNVLHLMLASNEEWAIPAGVDERRFFVLDVPSTRRGDHAYFAALAAQMETGGAAAMLFDLQRVDLSAFNVRDVPQTAALVDQKARSLRGPAAWLYEALQAGEVAGHVWPAEPRQRVTRSDRHKPGPGPGELAVPRDLAYVDFTRYSERQREYRPAVRSMWGKSLSAILGDRLRTYRPESSGNPDRARYMVLAPLRDCRRAFEVHLCSGPIEWEAAPGEEGAGDVDLFD